MLKRDDLLDLNDVLQHPGRELTVDIETELPDEPDVDLVSPLMGTMNCISTGNLLLVSGDFSTRAVFECARCTGDVELPIEFAIDEQFPVEGTPSSLNPQDSARVAPEEPYPMFDGNSLMVEVLLRQSLLLSLPLQPLCSFGWDGPCPKAALADASRDRPAEGRPEFERLSNLLNPGEPPS